MFYDKEKKTIKIPVRINKGQVHYFYGGNLPQMEENIIGELIIPEYGVIDAKFIDTCQKEEIVEILPEETIIKVAVRIKMIPEDKKNYIEQLDEFYTRDNVFVEIILKESLFLLLRGSKKPTLNKCKCHIPSLGVDADSLNNGYTLISEVFEPKRMSHTGNVFHKCFYKDANKIWRPLDHLRKEKESELEGNLFLDYKIFIQKVRIPDSLLLEDELKLVKHFEKNAEISGKEIKELFKRYKLNIQAIHSLIDKGVIEEKAGDGNELK